MAQINIGTVSQTKSNPLVETIAQLRHQFISMKTELRNVYDENCRLKDELEKHRKSNDDKLDVDFRTLRRRISYYCHPDRGGDIELMKDVNVLFDFLTSSTH